MPQPRNQVALKQIISPTSYDRVATWPVDGRRSVLATPDFRLALKRAAASHSKAGTLNYFPSVAPKRHPHPTVWNSARSKETPGMGREGTHRKHGLFIQARRPSRVLNMLHTAYAYKSPVPSICPACARHRKETLEKLFYI